MLARVKQLETCNREMFGDVVVTCQTSPKATLARIEPYVPPIVFGNANNNKMSENDKRRASLLVDQLLSEIYSRIGNGNHSNNSFTDYNSATSSRSGRSCRWDEKTLWEQGK